MNMGSGPLTMPFDIRDLLVLSKIPGIGPYRLRSLVNHFKDPAAIGAASPRQLVAVEGIEQKTAMTIAGFFRGPARRDALRCVDDQLAQMRKAGARCISLWDGEYPANLKRIDDPPSFLFVRGPLSERDNYSIAIVGTREPTSYGTHMAEYFAVALTRLGLPVVSGLARGIDTEAHTSVIKAGGRTLAVIGSGVDVIYPPENAKLAERIAETGAVISEYEMGTKPDAGNFPRRNRIISGLALGTIIVETGPEGGAMITARNALEQNREVFAVPSAVHEGWRSGTNALIKEGKAKLTEHVDDIIAELAHRLKGILSETIIPRAAPPADLTFFERQVYDALADEPLHIDMLSKKAGLTTSETLVHLLSLEFKNLVHPMPGKMFVKMQ